MDRAAQEPVADPWEGFAAAHTWISADHSWWHLIPRPVDAPAPAGGARLGFDLPCHVLTAYNPGGRAAAEVDNRAAARALRTDPWPDGLMLLPSFGGHADGRWLEPGIAVIGLSRHQARALGRAYGQLAVYELEETTRRVLACDSDHLLVQAVVCHREQQPTLSGEGHLDRLKVPRQDHRQPHVVGVAEEPFGVAHLCDLCQAALEVRDRRCVLSLHGHLDQDLEAEADGGSIDHRSVAADRAVVPARAVVGSRAPRCARPAGPAPSRAAVPIGGE